MDKTYTHPDVLGKGVAEGWADPITDPTEIDWKPRQDAAAIWFPVIEGRPVNPFAPTGIRYGRNELGHWGEKQAADAFVTIDDAVGRPWLAMVERDDDHGWALPGGCIDPEDASPLAAALRELGEEAGLNLPASSWAWTVSEPRYVPDPRASDEAWMVTHVASTHLGRRDHASFPTLVGADDARRAEWIRADDYATLAAHLAAYYGGIVFAAHRDLLCELLGSGL